ncbi:MAG: hypothetical protein EOO11_13530 [Chitinophagaceae bacterium]|nr:MAG: hypothetical protein EOO11_13530 [Chitinophagaceae bacterium]
MCVFRGSAQELSVETLLRVRQSGMNEADSLLTRNDWKVHLAVEETDGTAAKVTYLHSATDPSTPRAPVVTYYNASDRFATVVKYSFTSSQTFKNSLRTLHQLGFMKYVEQDHEQMKIILFTRGLITVFISAHYHPQDVGKKSGKRVTSYDLECWETLDMQTRWMK